MGKKIIWFLDSKKYRFSGILNYSLPYIKLLKNSFNLDIEEVWLPDNLVSKVFIKYVGSFVKSYCHYNTLKIFCDESYLPIFQIPIDNSICIVHDIRSLHLKFFRSKRERVYFNLLKKFYKNMENCEAVVTPSRFTKREIKKFFDVTCLVIPSPIDLNIYRPIEKKTEEIKKFLKRKYNLKDLEKRKMILYVGSEETRKNVDIILRALENLSDEVIFIKIGKAIIQENRIKNLQLCEKLNICAYFLDHVSQKDLIAFYNIADVFVLPSEYEGFGRTVLEAQACGCPVIASNRGALAEVVDKSAMILKDPKNAAELEKKIEKILYDKNLRKKFIKRGLGNVKRFEIKKHAKTWYNVISHFGLKNRDG